MSNIIQVSMGEMAVAQENVVLSSGGIGSCIVICMYDREMRIGGLAHAMLPKRRGTALDSPILDSEAKYVDESIDKLMSRLLALGARKIFLSVKLVGGATMFHLFKDKIGKSIGEQNIEAAHRELLLQKLSLTSEDVGGTIGRTVEFNLANGVIAVNLKL